jgi:hypothetical protein
MTSVRVWRQCRVIRIKMCGTVSAESHVSQSIDRRYIDCVTMDRFSQMMEHLASAAASQSGSTRSLYKKLFVEALSSVFMDDMVTGRRTSLDTLWLRTRMSHTNLRRAHNVNFYAETTSVRIFQLQNYSTVSLKFTCGGAQWRILTRKSGGAEIQ